MAIGCLTLMVMSDLGHVLTRINFLLPLSEAAQAADSFANAGGTTNARVSAKGLQQFAASRCDHFEEGTRLITLVLEIWSWILSISSSRFISERSHG